MIPIDHVDIQHDNVANSVYLRVRPGKVDKTVVHREGVYLDVAADGALLGVEAYLPVTSPNP